MTNLTIHDAMPQYERRRMSVICECGHVERKHETTVLGATCDGPPYPTATCSCRAFRPVIEVPNSRVFGFGRLGDGHPLVKGVIRTHELGRWDEIRWIEKGCDTAGCEHDWVTAVYVDDGKRTELRCEEHG